MAINVTSKLVLGFVTLLLGAVLIGVIATNGLVVTDKTTIADEYFNMADAYDAGNINTSFVFTVEQSPAGWKVLDCPLTSVTVSNGTGATGTALTLTTDYTFTASTGDFLFLNTEAVNQTFLSDNSTYVDYTYCGDDYMNLSWGRTVINLVSGFFALALLGASLGLFFSVAKDTGMI